MRLEVDNLAAVRGGRRVFAGVGFAIEAGVAVELRGPNGVGKSSLLRVLAGLTPPEGGAARLVEGEWTAELGRGRDAYLERVLYSGHADALKPTLTVAENLGFWARWFGAAPARVGAALDLFGLGALADTAAGLCSAGQKRRLGLARLALVERPLWLLDEPTVSLDVAAVDVFGALLERHLASGGLALVATHAPLPLAERHMFEMGAPLDVDAPAPADPFLDGWPAEAASAEAGR